MLLRTLALFLLACVAGSTAWGQTPDPRQAATEQTREMANRLHLNEGQFVKLFSLNRTRLARQQEIEHSTPHDLASQLAQLAELQAQYEQECSRIMSPSQLSQLLQETSQTGGENNN